MAETNPDAISQASYNGTPYEDASWEVVGDFKHQEEFLPLEVAVMSVAVKPFDPMFANYGGLSTEPITSRWHLPEGVSAQQSRQAHAKDDPAIAENEVRLAAEELERIRSEADAAGFERGIRETQASMQTALSQREARLARVLTDLNAQLKEQLSLVERQAIELALNISRKVISFAVEINPEYIAQIINDAIAQSGAAAVRRIRVSPEDMEFIDVVGIEKQLENFNPAWKFEADATIKTGCVVETSAGEIDYQLDAAWERIRENIVKVTR